jgi:hypothetical protein
MKRVSKPVAELLLPPLQLTPTEVAHMLVALHDYECDCDEKEQLISNLSYQLAMSHIYKM